MARGQATTGYGEIMTTTISVRLIQNTEDGQRYMRLIDTTDILRSVAGSLEKLDLCDSEEIADILRKIARELEDKVAEYRIAQP